MSQKNHARKRQYKKLGEHHVSDREMWNLFDYHARYILAGLRKFYSADRHGTSPNDILEKAYKKYGMDPYTCNAGREDALKKADDDARAEWDGILREMIWTFDQVARDFPDEPFSVWCEKETSKLEAQGKPSYKIRKDDSGTYYDSGLPPTPASVKADMEAYQKRIKADLHLYADYFLDLWD